jgi:hypothetical protein
MDGHPPSDGAPPRHLSVAEALQQWREAQRAADVARNSKRSAESAVRAAQEAEAAARDTAQAATRALEAATFAEASAARTAESARQTLEVAKDDSRTADAESAAADVIERDAQARYGEAVDVAARRQVNGR